MVHQLGASSLLRYIRKGDQAVQVRLFLPEEKAASSGGPGMMGPMGGYYGDDVAVRELDVRVKGMLK